MSKIKRIIFSGILILLFLLIEQVPVHAAETAKFNLNTLLSPGFLCAQHGQDLYYNYKAVYKNIAEVTITGNDSER